MADPDAGHRGTVADPDYCPSCGTELGEPGIFCPACGTRCRPDPEEGPASRVDEARRREDPVTGGPSPDRTAGNARRGNPGHSGRGPHSGHGTGGPDPSGTDPGDYGESERAFRRRVEEWEVEGWEVESDRGDSVVLLGRSYGSWGAHVLVFLLTGWFTLGLGNLLYGIYRHQSDPDRVVLRRGGPTAGDPRHERGGSLGNALLGLGLFLAGIASLVPLPPDPTGALFGAFLFAVGAAVFPPTRRRIRERHPVGTFGRVKSTDERVVRDPTKPCTVCGSTVEGGVERHYREELVVAGIPLVTTDEGTNHYCRACRSGEAVPGESGDAIDAELAAIVGGSDGEESGDGGPTDGTQSDGEAPGATADAGEAGDEVETATD